MIGCWWLQWNRLQSGVVGCTVIRCQWLQCGWWKSWKSGAFRFSVIGCLEGRTTSQRWSIRYTRRRSRRSNRSMSRCSNREILVEVSCLTAVSHPMAAAAAVNIDAETVVSALFQLHPSHLRTSGSQLLQTRLTRHAWNCPKSTTISSSVQAADLVTRHGNMVAPAAAGWRHSRRRRRQSLRNHPAG